MVDDSIRFPQYFQFKIPIPRAIDDMKFDLPIRCSPFLPIPSFIVIPATCLVAIFFALFLNPSSLLAQTGEEDIPELDQQAEAHLRLGIDFFLTDELEIAIDEFREAARLRSGYADAYHNLGVVLAKRGDLTRAIAAWTQAQRLAPNSMPVHYHLSALVSYNYGVALLSQNKLDRAMEEWAYALRIQPNFAEAHYAEGLGYLAKGDPLQAIAKFQQALIWHPDWAMAHFQLGVAHYENREFRMAEASWHKALKLDHRFAKAHANLGLIRLIEGDLTAAIAAFQQAIALDSDLPEAHFNLGVARYTKGEWQTALNPLQQVLNRQPQFLAARQMLGAVWANLGHWAKAISEWRTALQTHPTGSEAATLHYDIGLALFMMGDMRGARGEFRRALMLRPEWAEAHYKMGTVSILGKEWQLGLEHFQRVVDLQPSWAQAFFGLGKVYYQLGQVTEAINALRDATRLEPRFADAAYHLGVMLRAHNRSEEAVGPLQVAAKSGIEDAQSLLASMYANGSGIDQNIPMAMIWWARLSSKSFLTEAGIRAKERLSQLRRQFLNDQLSMSKVSEIQTGFSLIRQALRQTVRDVDGYSFEQSLGQQLLQHDRVSEAIPVLIQEALTLDPSAHNELEQLYLNGVEGRLNPFDERILGYFIETALENNPQPCTFLKRVVTHRDIPEFDRVKAAVQSCPP